MEAKVFPPGKPGGFDLKFAPNQGTPALPPSQNFKDWANYYTSMIEYYVSVLNGLQFDFDLSVAAAGEAAAKQKFEQMLLEFAGRLDIGGPTADAANPSQLVWPLAGFHEFRYHHGAEDLVLSVFYETDRETCLVTNCSVELRAEATGGGAGPMNAVGSSSSYVVPSSSSSHP